MLRFQCTVQIVNRDAAAEGLNGCDRAVKGVISLRKSSTGQSFICISNAKNVMAYQYSIQAVSGARSQLLREGKLTLIIRQPAVNVMIRDALFRDLERFIDEIKKRRKVNPVLSPVTATGKEKPSDVSSNGNALAIQPEHKRELKNFDTNRGPAKKRAGADMGPLEAANIKRALIAPSTSLKVKRMSAYPVHGFSENLKEVIMNDVNLKKVDSRMLKLENLQILDLSNNRIESVDLLTGLVGQLKALTLNRNRVCSISNDFFTAASMRNLEYLSLNDNQLTALPKSTVGLGRLKHLSVSNNKLTVLPYNMDLLKSLVNLTVDGNRLTFLPYPLTFMRLNNLNISSNLLPIQRGPVQADVLRKGFTTLFELTADFIANHNDRKYAQPTKLLRIIPSEIPRIACDMVDACKRCSKCGILSCRYSLKNQRSRICADSIVSDLAATQLPTKVALCEKCSFI